MRKIKVTWSWGYGVTAAVIVFYNGRGKMFERDGYRGKDADCLVDYLNTRG
jgi:hypothetical protein